MWACPNCGEKIEDDFDICWKCQAGTKPAGREDGVSAEGEEQAHSSGGQAVSGTPPLTIALSKRYKDAYLVAKAVIVYATIVKGVAVISSILALIVVLVVSGAGPRGFDSSTFLLGILVAGILGFVVYCLGVLIAAVGQHLFASLDTAVNSSPFLSGSDKAQILSLPAPSSLYEMR
jgi:hypothetical protein